MIVTKRCLRCGRRVMESGYAPDSSLGLWSVHFICSECNFMWSVADDGSLEYYDNQFREPIHPFAPYTSRWMEIEIGLLPIFKEEEPSNAMQAISFG